MSDFGWMMTLGVEELGMLLAVDSGKKSRALSEIESKLEIEVDLLRKTKHQIEQKLMS